MSTNSCNHEGENSRITRDQVLAMSVDDWRERGLRLDDAHSIIQFHAACEFIAKLNISEGMRIADVGSGPGHQSKLFQLLGADVVAVDFRRPVYGDIPWVSPDQQVGHEGRFDLVWSHHCLEHVFNPIQALARWNALLKHDGCLCLTVPECSMNVSSGHVNAYSLPLMMYHLAVAGFSLRGKCFTKSRSHLRAYVKKSDLYSPAEGVETSLCKLDQYGLFPPSMSEAIRNTGRFTAKDIHLNWFGESRQPQRSSIEAHEFVLDAMWR